MKTILIVLALFNYVAIVNACYVLTYQPEIINIENLFVVTIMHVIVAVMLTSILLKRKRT